MTEKTTYVKPILKAMTRLSANGRIVIPAEIRQALGLEPGQNLYLEVEDGFLRVESHAAVIRRIQNEFAQFARPGIRASDELIAERREEARREMDELQGEKGAGRIEKAS